MKGLENTLRRTLGLSIPGSNAGKGSDSEPTRTFFFSLIVFEHSLATRLTSGFALVSPIKEIIFS
jgi:hypothetical protein